MTDLVRVKDKSTGHEFSWPADLVEGVEGVETLDKPAVGPDGLTLPPKYRTTVNQAAEKKATSSGQKADTRKDTD